MAAQENVKLLEVVICNLGALYQSVLASVQRSL